MATPDSNDLARNERKRFHTIPVASDHPLAEADDAYARYAELRRETPLLEVRTPETREILVARHADVEQILKDERASVNRLLSPRFREASAKLPEDLRPEAQNPSMLTVDPPHHTRLRGLVAKAFTPGRVLELEPRIRHLAEQLLDRLPADDVDLFEQFAVPLPARVIAELEGVPAEDHERFRSWSDRLVGTLLGETGDVAAFRRARDDLRAYLARCVAARRASPGDDLISAMIEVQEDDGDRLSDDEMIGTCNLLLLAGHETTTHWIGASIARLLEEPGWCERLRDEPEHLRAFLDEILRLESPFQAVLRIPTEPIELDGGERLPEGVIVHALIGSANRDESVFDDADAVVLDREERHLAFSVGRHRCLGAALAELEARVAIETLLRRVRLEAIEAKPPRFRQSLLARRVDRVPARIAPA